MKIAIVVNDIQTEESGYTTIRLMHAAVAKGHSAWITGVGDLTYGVDEKVYAKARTVTQKAKDHVTLLRNLKAGSCATERICLDDLDIVLLRNNPADDVDKPWAQTAGVVFGRMAMRGGVIVLNDPDGLSRATNKMYFQSFPEEVRPRSIITRDRAEIRRFAREENGHIIIKPLQGCG